MRKLLFIPLLIILFPGITITNPIIEVEYPGHCVNVVKDDEVGPLSVNFGSNVFDEQWLNSLELEYQEIDRNITGDMSGSSIDNVSNKVNDVYLLMTTNSSIRYPLDLKFHRSSSDNYFVYLKVLEIRKYSLSLPDYQNNLDLYKSNLSPAFIYYLDKLQTKKIIFEEFFDIFGTHIIANGIYGGRLEVFVTVKSDSQLTKLMQNQIYNELSLSFSGLGTTTFNYHIDRGNLQKIKGDENIWVSENYSAIGGCPFGFFDFTNAYSKWIKSLDDEASFIGYGADGLIPLWEIIPDDYNSLKDEMFKGFLIYQNNHQALRNIG